MISKSPYESVKEFLFNIEANIKTGFLDFGETNL